MSSALRTRQRASNQAIIDAAEAEVKRIQRGIRRLQTQIDFYAGEHDAWSRKDRQAAEVAQQHAKADLACARADLARAKATAQWHETWSALCGSIGAEGFYYSHGPGKDRRP